MAWRFSLTVWLPLPLSRNLGPSNCHSSSGELSFPLSCLFFIFGIFHFCHWGIELWKFVLFILLWRGSDPWISALTPWIYCGKLYTIFLNIVSPTWPPFPRSKTLFTCVLDPLHLYPLCLWSFPLWLCPAFWVSTLNYSPAHSASLRLCSRCRNSPWRSPAITWNTYTLGHCLFSYMN